MGLLRYIFFLFSLSISINTYAQQNKTVLDNLIKKIELAGNQKLSATLFVHFDKNIYANSENVWFTAYILKNHESFIHHTLSVAVVRNDDWSVLAQAKFIINNELAFGNIVLPDSLPTGNYSFICYTNQMINAYPSAVFVQPVTIKTSDANSFIAKLSLMDSIMPGMDSIQVLLKAYNKDITLVKGGLVKYFIGDRLHPLRSGTLKTDKFGEATITIPLKDITPANNTLQTEIYNGTNIQNFSIKLPVYKNEPIIKFYPEGGNLIEAVPNTVGWEITNSEKEPMAVSAALYKGDTLLQTINTNIYGMGKFVFTPDSGKSYYVKLNIPANDSQYILPKVLQSGTAITIANALTTDTLFINANDKGISNKLLLLVHDYKNVFVSATVVTNGKPVKIKIPLTDVPKGINTLTVLDSIGRPLAERLLFAHFDDKPVVNISTDSATYAIRKQVQVKLKITDAHNLAVAGLVSVACVQNNRLDLQKMMNIESYTYLTEGLTDFPFKKDILADNVAGKDYLEQLLLIRGWRKYKWQDVENITAADTNNTISSLAFNGTVTMKKKSVKKVMLLNLRAQVTPKLSELNIIKTDAAGNFELLPKDILATPNSKLNLSVRNAQEGKFIINVADPYKAMNKQLAASLPFYNYSERSFVQNSQAFVFKNDEVTKTLKTVVVLSKKDNSFYATRVPGVNVCGDYVCSYGVLNCINHPSERYQPVVGSTYKVGGGGGSSITYSGCWLLTHHDKDMHTFAMEAIYSPKEFYVTDISKADAFDPQYLSTIYWNYALLTNKNGEASFGFYTSDIVGKFKIVVQGITNNDVVYGELVFEVKE